MDEINFIQTVATEEKGITELYKVVKENIHRLSPEPFIEIAYPKSLATDFCLPDA